MASITNFSITNTSITNTRSSTEGLLVPKLPTARWKRWFDLVVAIGVMVALAPVWLVIATVSGVVLGRPIFFRQPRGGHGGQQFEIIKFRTMSNTCSPRGHQMSDERRRSKWGNFLRKTSLDELPTLLNVVCGEMSIVGPRPLVAEYLDRYSPEQAQRHSVLPGITGLAQTRGRNELSWEKKFELDLEYVRTRSPRLDLCILRDTVATVLSRQGADGKGDMTEFVAANQPQV